MNVVRKMVPYTLPKDMFAERELYADMKVQEVVLELPNTRDVIEQVQEALEREEMENYKPTLILLGGENYWALGDSGVAYFQDVPVMLDVTLGERAVHVLCARSHQEAKHLRKRAERR
jgi:hypothetical protein